MLKTSILPIAKPYLGAPEFKNVLSAMVSSRIGGASSFNSECEKQLSNIVSHKYTKLTSNGTVALQVAFEAAKHHLKKDRLTVIVPNVTLEQPLMQHY